MNSSSAVSVLIEEEVLTVVWRREWTAVGGWLQCSCPPGCQTAKTSPSARALIKPSNRLFPCITRNTNYITPLTDRSPDRQTAFNMALFLSYERDFAAKCEDMRSGLRLLSGSSSGALLAAATPVVVVERRPLHPLHLPSISWRANPNPNTPDRISVQQQHSSISSASARG